MCLAGNRRLEGRDVGMDVFTVDRWVHEAALQHQLFEYFGKVVKHQIADDPDHPKVVEISRLELLARLMGGACLNRDENGKAADIEPGFRRECLKAVLDRISPTKTGDALIAELNIVVNSPMAIVYAEQLKALERRDGRPDYAHVMEVLRSMPVDAMLPVEVDHEVPMSE